MKKLYFFLVTMLVAFAANASKVYFDNSDTNWSAVKAYVWKGTYSNKWPGEDMTLNQTTGLYEIEFNGTPGMIIFNNGAGTQTGDLPFVDGATYDKNGEKGAALNTYTVTFDNTKSGWSEVYAYYWGGGATNSWPGDKMTQGEGNLWTIEIKAASAPQNIIFNKGNDTGKTEDLKFEDGATYDKDGKVTGEPVVEPDPDPDPEVVGKTWNFSDWENQTILENTEIDGLKIFTTSTLTIEENKKTVDGVTYTKRFKFGGKATWKNGAPTNRVLAFDVPGDCTIFCVLTSSSSSDRELAVYAGDNNNEIGTFKGLGGKVEYQEMEYVGEATTIYFSPKDGVNLYMMGYACPAGEEEPETTAYTVTYNNGKTAWEEVYAYCWTDGKDGEDAWPGKKMTLDEGNIYTVTFNLVDAPDFIKFTNNAGAESENFDFVNGKEYGEAAEEVSYDGWYLKVPGDWNGWNQYDGGVEYNKMNNYNAFVTIDSYKGGFKVQIWNGTKNLWYSNGQKLEPGEEYVLTGDNGGNMTLDSKYEGWLVYVNFDIKTMTLSVEVVEPIQGNYVYFDNTLAGFPNPMMLCLDETSQVCGGGLMEQCAPTPEWMQTQYVAMADGYKAWDYNTYKGVVPKQAVKVIFLDNDDFDDMSNSVGPFEPVAGHVYGMEGDLGTYEQAVTGVESIAAENAAPVYFNLQGQRVENPANGVFIRIANGKVAKVLVK